MIYILTNTTIIYDNIQYIDIHFYNYKINAILNPRSLPSTTLSTLNAFLLCSHNIPEVELHLHFTDQEIETKLA